MQDVSCFLSQISSISDKGIRTLVISVLQSVPKRFYTEGASSTGKYHSPISQGEGGLVRHTKLLVKFAEELLKLEMYEELNAFRDEIYAALLLHDCIKFGWDEKNQHTDFQHPNLAADFVFDKAMLQGNLKKEQINRICSAIRSHGGQWNKNREGVEILPKPSTNIDRFVHLCDFLASRTWVSVSDVADLN